MNFLSLFSASRCEISYSIRPSNHMRASCEPLELAIMWADRGMKVSEENSTPTVKASAGPVGKSRNDGLSEI